MKTNKVKKDNKVHNAVILSVLGTITVIGILAVTFVAGIKYEQNKNAQVQSAVNAALESKEVK